MAIVLRASACSLAAIALTSILGAASLEAAAREPANTTVGIGYRNDDLRWNIASDPTGTQTPNILSELTWKDVRSVQLRIASDATFPSGWHLRGAAAYGKIIDGEEQDSDYAGDDRTLEFSRSVADNKDSAVIDAELGFGYRVTLGPVHLTPLLSFTYHKLDFNITNGVQVIATPGLTPPTGPFPGLDSTYEATWMGPALALELGWDIGKGVTLTWNSALARTDYKAEAQWNLRPDLQQPKSFEHKAEGSVRSDALTVWFRASRESAYELRIDRRKGTTDPGTDRVFFANGTTAETMLREVVWDAKALHFSWWFNF